MITQNGHAPTAIEDGQDRQEGHEEETVTISERERVSREFVS